MTRGRLDGMSSRSFTRASGNESLLAAAVLAVVAAAVPAQRQFDELRKRGLPADNDATTAVALGDVDGDGDLDLVTANTDYFGGRQNRLYLDDGSGVYRDATTAHLPPGSDNTLDVALGDVDGDGDLDIVFANGYANGGQQNRLLLNDGTGTYTDATAARMPSIVDDTRSVVLGDVDGDGDLDIVTANYQFYLGQQNRLYLNDGTGTFTDATAARMPADSDQTRAVALGDVDGDGDLDIVTANTDYFGGQQNRLYLNNGTGAFTDATSARIPSSSDYSYSVVLGDVDGDGDLDLVFGNGPAPRYGTGAQNRLYLNTGTGTYVDATAGRLPADYDLTYAVALADVEGDGDLDLVTANSEWGLQNRLSVNDGTGTFTDVTAARMPADSDHSRAVGIGDVDGDGDLDVVLGNAVNPYCGEQNRLYLNNGTGAYVDATAPPLPADSDYSNSVALGDVDGDRDLDMVVANGWPAPSKLYLNDGTGAYGDVTVTHLPTVNAAAVAMGDVDGDGDLDLVFGANPIRLYLNGGTGTFSDATHMHLPGGSGSAAAVALGDVDADGDLDIVFATPYGQNRLYLNDGTGIFADATATSMPTRNDNTSSVALGDVDADGDLDIVFGNASGPNRLYLNDGTGTFADVTTARLPAHRDATQAVLLGDVDGDGDLDIVVGNNAAPQQNRLYLNDGTGAFSDATSTRLPAHDDYTYTAALGDVDGDGDLDLLFGNGLNEQTELLLNDGTGTFADATAARMPPDADFSFAAVLGDVDADGDLDVVIGNGGQNRLYLNLLQQLDAPHLLRVGRTYTLEAYKLYGPPSSTDLVVPMLSTATANIPVPPLGTFGLAPTQTVTAAPFVIPQPAGVGSVTFTVPAAPGLVGTWLYAQALLVPYPFPARLTNVTADQLIQ